MSDQSIGERQDAGGGPLHRTGKRGQQQRGRNDESKKTGGVGALLATGLIVKH